MSLSVALCTYNGERFLDSQLASLAGQSRLPDELVVCDDASSDATGEILRRFAEGAPFPVHIHVNAVNVGYAANFGQAIGLCQGDLIALCDQDDIWRAWKLDRQVALLQEDPRVGLVFSDAELIDGAGTPTGQRLQEHYVPERAQRLLEEGKGLQVLLRRRIVTGTTMVFRARYRSDILPIPPGWPHDAWIALVVAARARLAFIREPLVAYRLHGSNAIGVPDLDGRLAYRIERAGRSQREEYLAEASDCRWAHDRLASMPAGEGFDEATRRWLVEFLEGRAAHMTARGNLPVPRRNRLGTIGAELVAGRYHRHSAGLRSAAKDLLLS